MRRLLVEVTCDKCGTTASEEEAVNVELVLSNAPNQTLEIDLCSGCVDGFVQGARLKPKERKRNKKKKEIDSPPASPPAEDTAGFKCPVCSNTYSTDRGLRAHQTRAEH